MQHSTEEIWWIRVKVRKKYLTGWKELSQVKYKWSDEAPVAVEDLPNQLALQAALGPLFAKPKPFSLMQSLHIKIF